jgi:hypothetical protein
MATRGMFWVCLSAAVLLWVGTAAALEPDEKCQAAKNKDTGKLASCLESAEAKLVKTKGACSAPADKECYRDGDCTDTCVKDTTKYDAAIAKCNEKFLAKWAKDEAKGETQCPDGIADPNSMLDFVTDHSNAVSSG